MTISIECAPHEPQLAGLTALGMERGATVADALERLGIELGADIEVGVWGRKVRPDHKLENGDRVEFYRPLRCDPKAARRARARKPRN